MDREELVETGPMNLALPKFTTNSSLTVTAPLPSGATRLD